MNAHKIDRGTLLSRLMSAKSKGRLAPKYQQMTDKEYIQHVLDLADELDMRRSAKENAGK